MATEYVPMKGYSFDPKYCKAAVFPSNGWSSYQCSNTVKKDGWCGTHHPDAEAKRRKKSDDKYKAERKRSDEKWERERLDEEKAKAFDWIENTCSDVGCNWTTPDAWTVFTFDSEATPRGEFHGLTLIEAVRKAMEEV